MNNKRTKLKKEYTNEDCAINFLRALQIAFDTDKETVKGSIDW